MRFQSLLLAATAIHSLLAAAHYHGHPLHERRSDAMLRARDAVAEASYYDQLLARDFDDDDDINLFTREAEPDYDDELDRLLARSPGNKPSKSGGGGKSALPVSPTPPKLGKLRKCKLCGTMCSEGQEWHKSGPHHKGGAGKCEEIAGQH